ncbi:MAG: hypothetical protein Q9191_001426 [Dirinaria sp. TL-2023a]
MSSAPRSPQRPLIAIVGVTGTGKSQLAVALARRFHGEIINCDALQMYEGLPIATNKIPVTERHSIPHHLLGFIKLDQEPWAVTRFKARATQVIEEIRVRGKLPILVGGTHYYVQSLLFKDALVESGPEYLTAEEQENRWPVLGASTEEMLEELRKVDPVMAARWHPKDTRKIRRSLEIYLSTGQKASEAYQAQWQRRQEATNREGAVGMSNQGFTGEDRHKTIERADVASDHDPLIFCTYASPENLRPRLESRVNTMLEEGLLSEVELMYKFRDDRVPPPAVFDQSRGVWVAIGYKEFLPYLLAVKAGDTSAQELEHLKLECIQRTYIRTRQYAKSQVKWIRGKLLPALTQYNMHANFFMLDATDLSKWHEKVQGIADETTTAFLQGSNLPKPREWAITTIDLLQQGKEQAFCSRYCDTCNKTLMTEDAWNVHIRSKKHRAAARGKKSEPLTSQSDW